MEYRLLGGHLEEMPATQPSSANTDLSSDDSNASMSVLSENSPGYSELSKSSPYPLPSPLTTKIRSGVSTSLDSAEALRAFKSSSRPKDTFSPLFLKKCVSAFDESTEDVTAILTSDTSQDTGDKHSISKKHSSIPYSYRAVVYFLVITFVVSLAALVVNTMIRNHSVVELTQLVVEQNDGDLSESKFNTDQVDYHHDERMNDFTYPTDYFSADFENVDTIYETFREVDSAFNQLEGVMKSDSELMRTERKFSLRKIISGIMSFPGKVVSNFFHLFLFFISRIFMQSAILEE